MLVEDVASNRIHQDHRKPKSRLIDKGPDEEDGVRAIINFSIRLFV
jgi:hypothetical protein